jgi:hypothetical protein
VGGVGRGGVPALTSLSSVYVCVCACDQPNPQAQGSLVEELEGLLQTKDASLEVSGSDDQSESGGVKEHVLW